MTKCKSTRLEWKNAYKLLIGILEKKRLLGRPERRWQNNINLDYKEIVCEGLDRVFQVAGPCVHGNEFWV
jgi:hypothetical protein